MKFLIFSLFFTLSSARFFTNNPCAPILRNFDVKKYEGTWYKVMRTPNEYQDGFDCITMDNVAVNNHTIDSNICEIYKGNKKCFHLYSNQHESEAMFTAIDSDSRKLKKNFKKLKLM